MKKSAKIITPIFISKQGKVTKIMPGTQCEFIREDNGHAQIEVLGRRITIPATAVEKEVSN